jgi:5-methylcytosine-specific restriction endonuclease McrA
VSPSLRTLPPPRPTAGLSPYIDASIRRRQLEDEQARILQQVCAELNIDPRIERRRKHKHARSYSRIVGRRTDTTLHRFAREDIIARDKSTCYLCGKVCEKHEIHLDHVIPLSRGGEHTIDNIKVACATCNLRKRDSIVTS